MRNPPLTHKHEQFVREYIKTGIGSEAYARVYSSKKPTCHRAAASRMIRYPRVKKYYEELRAKMAKRSDITLEKILTDYQHAMNRDDAKPSDIIAAATAQAKLVGLLIERKEVGSAGDFDGMNNVSEILEAVREQAGDDAALALSKVFNLMSHTASIAKPVTIDAPVDEESTEALFQAKPGSNQVN